MPTLHYVPKKISEIKNTDQKVSIVGKIVAAEKNLAIIKDDSGQADIFTDDTVEAGHIVRAFCSFVGGRLKLDVVQNLDGLDLNLYKKIKELYSRAGV